VKKRTFGGRETGCINVWTHMFRQDKRLNKMEKERKKEKINKRLSDSAERRRGSLHLRKKYLSCLSIFRPYLCGSLRHPGSMMYLERRFTRDCRYFYKRSHSRTSEKLYIFHQASTSKCTWSF
jgi:hypothetical protein